MSFLRRKHRRRDGAVPTDGTNLIALPEDDTASMQAASLLLSPSIKSISLRKRLSSLSSLASSLKRGRSHSSQPPASGGLGYISAYRAPSPNRSPSPEPSLEIRRPSGLGRRASITELLFNQSQEEKSNGVYQRLGRKHSISTPELTLRPDGLLQWSHIPTPEVSRPVTPSVHKALPAIPAFTRMSPSLFKTALQHVASADLISAARACKALAVPAKELLYENIDLLRVVNRRRVEKCISLLASRRDLAGLVRHFACDLTPTASVAGGRATFSVVTFAIALSNMHALRSLTLPNFDATLLHHTTFRLRSLMFLCENISNRELCETLDWLCSQPELTALSFPNLVFDDSNTQLLASSGSQQQPAEAQESDSSHTPPLSPSDLPNLAEIQGPAPLLAALVPGRPLTSVWMHVHSTIYDGLRPSSLISALAGATTPITKFALITSVHHKVDARTVERTLMSVGARFGAHLQMLEVATTLEDEVLRKVISAVLPRYKMLHTLHLQRKSSPLPSTPPSTPSPRQSSSSPLPDLMFSESPSPTLRSPTLPPRVLERTSLAAWNRYCSSLRRVVFPTAAEWSISPTATAADEASATTFIFLGLRNTEAWLNQPIIRT